MLNLFKFQIQSFYIFYISYFYTMKAKLQKLLEENLWTITEVVITEALSSWYDNVKDYFTEIQRMGCQSGIVSSMIRTVDVYKFYDKHYEEIENIRLELQEEWILWNESIDQDLKTFYSWLSYEHIAYSIYNQIWEE